MKKLKTASMPTSVTGLLAHVNDLPTKKATLDVFVEFVQAHLKASEKMCTDRLAKARLQAIQDGAPQAEVAMIDDALLSLLPQQEEKVVVDNLYKIAKACRPFAMIPADVLKKELILPPPPSSSDKMFRSPEKKVMKDANKNDDDEEAEEESDDLSDA